MVGEADRSQEWEAGTRNHGNLSGPGVKASGAGVQRSVVGSPWTATLRRGRAKRRFVAVCVAVLLSALIAADRAGWLLDDPGDWARYEGKAFNVARVIDGDTLEIHAGDGLPQTTRVRLWGIDAPEHARPDLNRPAEPFAHEATDWLSQRCEGQRVTLHLQRHRLRGPVRSTFGLR